jgi:hypothetical protein
MTAVVPAPALALLDSVAAVEPRHRGLLVVTGSHGGASAAAYAARVRAWLYVFNDAGIGKDAAGIAALAVLDTNGQAAIAVAHTSARIGEAADTWAGGTISHVNAAAARLGLAPGQRLCTMLKEGALPPD